MPRFLHPGDWLVDSVQLRGGPGFAAVIYRREDPSTIWRWVCTHLDHATPEEALACGERKLRPDAAPVAIGPA